jgi:molybdate transport system substrate-binding protein
LICAGAGKGVVETLAQRFHEDTGLEIDATFGAVGAQKAKLDSGEKWDAIVLTAQLIAALALESRVRADTIAALGAVPTGIAVRNGDALPEVGDAASLRDVLLGSGAIYVPDPERATAGIHFMSVLHKLDIERDVATRLRPYPNGATAMRALADEGRMGDLGCTQLTEIRYTAGLTAVGPLPAGFDLATVYSAAVARDAALPDLARHFVTLLTGPTSAAMRAAGGFEIVG